jgi:hypothetical protein
MIEVLNWCSEHPGLAVVLGAICMWTIVGVAEGLGGGRRS